MYNTQYSKLRTKLSYGYPLVMGTPWSQGVWIKKLLLYFKMKSSEK